MSLEPLRHLQPLGIAGGIGLGPRDHGVELIMLTREIINRRIELSLAMRRDRRLQRTVLVRSDIVEGLAAGFRLQA